MEMSAAQIRRWYDGEGRKRKVACLLLMNMVLEDEEAEQQQCVKRQRTDWVSPFLQREGIFLEVQTMFRENNPALFKNFVRMTSEDFDLLFEKVRPLIEKSDTHLRKAIPAAERLCIVLRFLTTGDSYASLRYVFKRSKTSICRIVPEVCSALYTTLKDEYLKVPLSLSFSLYARLTFCFCFQVPSTEEEWKKIANLFENRWNFPNCFGAIDGKHVDIVAPDHSGSEYFNYKKRNSVVLMALVDGDYNFSYIDVGAKGRESDGGVYARCSLSTALETNTLYIPPPKPLLGRADPVPYVMVADDAFPLRPYIMKPFPFRNQNTSQRVFSYRLSRARRVAENAFGIAAARFRILRKPIHAHPRVVEKIILAICALHNFLMKRKSIYAVTGDLDKVSEDGVLTEGNWRREVNEREMMRPLHRAIHEGRGTDAAKCIREEFREYFINEGDVDWQYRYLFGNNQ